VSLLTNPTPDAILISGLNLSASQTVTITYKNATASTSAADREFMLQSLINIPDDVLPPTDVVTATGNIASFADAGGGFTTVTTTAPHGLPDGYVVPITGTTNYNGTFTISNAAGTTFDIEIDFVGDDATGTWATTPGGITMPAANRTIGLDGTGTASAAPSSLHSGSTGKTLNFEYIAEGDLTVQAALRIDIPSGWTSPQKDNETSAGYTDFITDGTDPGLVALLDIGPSGSYVQVNITAGTLFADETITVRYGKGGGTAGVQVQGTTGTAEFITSSKTSSDGTLVELPDPLDQPSVTITNAEDGSGSYTVTPTPTTVIKGSRGNSFEITFTALGAMPGGEVRIQPPAGWTTPQTTLPDQLGYTTLDTNGVVEADTLVMDGNTIVATISTSTLNGGESFTVTYGGTTAETGVLVGSTSPTNFTVLTKGLGAGAVDEVETQPPITLSDALAGTGSAAISSTSVVSGSSANTLVFTYTAEADMAAGAVSVVVPDGGWTAPQEGDNTQKGYVEVDNLTAGPDTVAPTLEAPPDDLVITDQTITVNIGSMNAGDSFDIIYGANAVGGGGFDVPVDPGTQVAFEVNSKALATQTETDVTNSPFTVNITGQDGSGEATATPTPPADFRAGAQQNIVVTYTASTDFTDGFVSVTIPVGFTEPQISDAAADGYVTATVHGAATTIQAPTNQEIIVPVATLINGQDVVVTYANGRAHVPQGVYQLLTKSQALSVGSLVPIVDSPTVIVSNAVAGSGTAELETTPASIITDSTGNILTFEFTSIGDMDGGQLDIVVPVGDGWTTPQGVEGTAGYTIASSTGTIGNIDLLTVLGTITVPITSLTVGDTITVAYGAGGGASGALARNTDGTSDFTISSAGIPGEGTAVLFVLNPTPPPPTGTLQVETVSDIPPSIAHTAQTTSPVSTAISLTANVAAHGTKTVSSVQVHYRKGGASFDTQRPLSPPDPPDGSYSGEIPLSSVTNTGLSYKIVAQDSVGLVSSTIRHNVQITEASVTQPNMLPAYVEGNPSRYRMVSVPIDGSPDSNTLFDQFGTGQWWAWRWTGEYDPENNGYRALHLTGNSMPHDPGIAVWAMTDQDPTPIALTVDDTNTPGCHPLDTTTPYAIRLNAGWNQFACPFNFKRLWDNATIKVGLSNNVAAAVDINTASSVTDPYPWVANFIYWWTPGPAGPADYDYSFASSDQTIPNQTVFTSSWRGAGDFEGDPTGEGWPGTLDAWGGYWGYAYVDCYLFIDPTTPGPGATPEPMVVDEAAPVISPLSWSVRLSAESGNSVDANNFAGIVQGADIGFDKYDVREAPSPLGRLVQLSFPRDDWGIMSGDYMQDMMLPADEMIWEVQAKAAGNLPVAIRWDASSVPTEYRTAMLIDTSTEARINLREVTGYAYTPSSADVRTFKLVISTALPEKYALVTKPELLQNYPNPFNPETWVPFKLSKASDVTIKIYNISGQLVRTLNLGHQESGAYLSKERAAYWNGRNEVGERVASGVYIYHIKAGSFYSSKKMVVLK
jgi:hypothetical protein